MLIKGTQFKPTTIFYTGRAVIRIFELNSILKDADEKLVFVCNTIRRVLFNEHLQSYEVKRTDEQTYLRNVEEIDLIAINLHIFNGKEYFRHCNFSLVE